MPTQVHIPASVLSNYVVAIWETNTPTVSCETVLPQGVVEIVFNLSSPMQGILPNATASLVAPDYFLQAWNSHIVQVQYTNQQHLLGIRLQPYMVKALLGMQASECKDSLIDLALLKPGFRSLWHQLNEAADFTERIAIIENSFPVLNKYPCERTQYFCDVFASAGEHNIHSIDELAKQVCYSSRQLNRKAQLLFGVSAEELLIHKKFPLAVENLHGPQQSLTEIAYQAGFYDQAHFCRVFKDFTGFTPKQYQSQKSELPFHIFS